MSDKVYTIFSEVMGTPLTDVQPDLTPESVENWDSLQHLNLIFALEEAFGVKFLDEEITNINSVQDILNILDKAAVKE